MKIMIMKMICVISIIIEVIMSFETYFINNINYEIIYLIYRFLSLFIAFHRYVYNTKLYKFIN